MLSTLRTRCRPVFRLEKFLLAPQRRHRVTSLSHEVCRATTPIAEKLDATGLWPRSSKTSGCKIPRGDSARINIVSEELCDDILNYMKPSLERHVGCDLLDLYPGVGLWSQKIHDILQPRTHIMLDPDAKIYEPFLDGILSKPNTHLIPRSGIVWEDLNDVLSPRYLPHQVVLDPHDRSPRQRNDTLLVIGNLALWPPRKFHDYSSMSSLLLYQLVRSLSFGSMFQKYGLVRMLLWVNDEEKTPLLPRSMQKRKRIAVEAELNAEWLTEIAGADENGAEGRYRRLHSVDVESALNVAERMRQAGKTIPPGREPKLAQEVRDTGGVTEAGKPTALAFYSELRDLQEHVAQNGEFKADDPRHRRLKYLGYRAAQESEIAKIVADLLERYDKLMERMRQESASPGSENWENPSDETKKEIAAYVAGIDALTKLNRSKFDMAFNNQHLFRQDPPVLHWDRREIEPLVTRPEEFFPNKAACLLDIQPKAAHPLLRESETRNVFDFLLPRLLTDSPPIRKILDGFCPGAAEGVSDECRSLRDPSVHGIPLPGSGQIHPRALNERQFVDLLASWKKWPFAPSYSELLGSLADAYVPLGNGEDEPETSGANAKGGYDFS